MQPETLLVKRVPAGLLGEPKKKRKSKEKKKLISISAPGSQVWGESQTKKVAAEVEVNMNSPQMGQSDSSALSTQGWSCRSIAMQTLHFLQW